MDISRLVKKFHNWAIIMFMLVYLLVAGAYSVTYLDGTLSGVIGAFIVFLMAMAFHCAMAYFGHTRIPDKFAKWIICFVALPAGLLVVLFLSAQAHTGIRANVENGVSRESLILEIKDLEKSLDLLNRDEQKIIETNAPRGNLQVVRERKSEQREQLRLARQELGSTSSGANAGIMAITKVLRDWGFDVSVGLVSMILFTLVALVVEIIFLSLLVAIPGNDFEEVYVETKRRN